MSGRFNFKHIYIFSLIFLFGPLFILQAQDSSKDLNIQELSNLSLTDLLDIKVTTVSKFSEKQSDAPGVVSVISKDEIERFGGQSLHEILERVPGLTGTSSYMTEHLLIAPRGNQMQASSAHVLLLINGRPIRESLEGGIKSEILATFPVESIERIEVIKGPGSVLYGSNAFTAVINIITIPVTNNSLIFSNFIGENDAYGTSANLSYIRDDLKILLGGKYAKKADWTPHYQTVDPNNPSEAEPNIPNAGFGTFLQMEYKNFNLMSSFNKWRTAFILPDRVSNTDGSWEKFFVNAGYDYQVSEKWNSTINVTLTNSRFVTTEYPDMKRNSYDLIAEFTNFIKLSRRSKIVFGALFNRIDGEEKFDIMDAESRSSADRNDFALYSQIEYQLTDNLSSVIGVQLNKIENVDLDFVPRLGLIWHPTKNITLKTLYSQAFRAPSIIELGSQNPFIQGNSNLEPEKVGTYDVEVSYYNKQLQASISFFHTSIKQIIFQNYDPDLEYPIYDNGGKTTSYGGEFETKLYVKQNILLLGSILIQDSEDRDELLYVTPSSNFGAKAGISYNYRDILTVSLFDIYTGDIERKSPSINRGYDSHNILNMYSKIRIDDLLHIKSDSKLFITLDINNIFDEEIWVPAYGSINDYSVPYKPGRTFYAGFNFEF